MSTMTLEPCPLCGTDDHETSPWPSGDEWVCRCGNPDCAVEVTAETPEDAVAKWNRRAHLAQPAQAVDVGMVREVIAELAKRANTGFNTNDRARCGHWETQLTRAIGNAQAEGWTRVGTLTVQRWKGIDSMLNTDFDYAGDLPDGDYQVFVQTQPQTEE